MKECIRIIRTYSISIILIVVCINGSCQRSATKNKNVILEKLSYMKMENSMGIKMMDTLSYFVTAGIALPEKEERGGHIGGLVQGKIIIAGGTKWSNDKASKFFLDDSFVFDNGEWSPGPLLPIPLSYSAYAHNRQGLYVAGGTSDGVSKSKKAFFLSSLQKDAEWQKLPDLPEALSFGAGAILNNMFYVVGGDTNKGNTGKMWVLDINNYNKGWVECKSLPGRSRILHSFVACGEYLYLLGGLAQISPLIPLSDVFRYDPEDNDWTQFNHLPIKGYGWVSQSANENKLLLTGRADGTVHNGIWMINTENMSMKEIGSLIIQSTTAPLVTVSENEWWLIGGEPDSNKTRTGEVSIIKLKNNEKTIY